MKTYARDLFPRIYSNINAGTAYQNPFQLLYLIENVNSNRRDLEVLKLIINGAGLRRLIVTACF